MATKVTNAQVDVLAAAIAAPYGPLVRVTDLDTDSPDPNKDFKILFDTAVSGVQVELTYHELNDADIAAAVIAQAFNFQDKLEAIIADLDTLNTTAQALALPHTPADYKTVYQGILGLAKDMNG